MNEEVRSVILELFDDAYLAFKNQEDFSILTAEISKASFGSMMEFTERFINVG